MKKKINYIISAGAVLAVALAGCKKDFFNRPPEDQSTVGTYYQTVPEIQSSTNILYAAPWFGLNGKAFLAVGDLQAGNAVCYAGTDGSFDAFRNFSFGNATQAIQSTWNSLYTVVAQANALLNNLPTAAPSSIPSNVVNNALGEAHVIRAAAYFYLVRLFGPVPIITDPTQFVGNFNTVPRNPVADVYKFMINDLTFGEQNCSANVASSGHVSSGSASGLLAKVYLFMQDYANARKEAEKVMNSGEFSLMPSSFYTTLFELAGNNSKESMIAMQWTSNGGYGFGNQIQSVIADGENGNFLTGTGDGYGELGPSWDLQDAFKNAGDSVRRHGSIMLAHEYYPELHAASGGYTVPYQVNVQGVHAAMKKYVVGTPADNNGNAAKQATANNTYILRYSDILLVEAEAILGASANVQPGTGISMSASTSDPAALAAFNMVRQRAMLPTVTSFSYAQLINERRLEFAIEGSYWYDLQRIDGFNNPHHPNAISIISSQNRGDSYGGTPANNYQDFTRNTVYVTPTDASFLMPIPATETAADPTLLQPPVPYKF
jgi:hypothetical protein